jgi:hypothetical protein
MAATSLWVTRLTATQSRLPRQMLRLITGGMAVDGGERVLGTCGRCGACCLDYAQRAPRREIAGAAVIKGDAGGLDLPRSLLRL